ncbi:MAG: hypothetical protein U0791_23895 [Gemmataceae bacterium]
MQNNLPNDAPRDNWTLEELGLFAQQVAKRTARDAWLLGRAYGIAKAKAKAEGKKIETWRRKWLPILSQPTLSRYEAVSKLPEDAVVGKGLTEVYRLLGLAPQKASPTASDSGVETPPATDAATEVAPTADGPIRESHPEPDSLLKRVAKVATLVRSLVTDLSSLEAKADDAEALDTAIHDAIELLNRLRYSVLRREAA